MYSPPEDAVTDPNLNGYCVKTSCYKNPLTNNITLNPDQCNQSYCEKETLVPTIPDHDYHHWFFYYALYVGGTIHLLMSLAMVISYFLINAKNFVLPKFVYQYMYVKLEYDI